MTSQEVWAEARMAGIELAVIPPGRLVARGPVEAVQRLGATIREHKNALIALIGGQTLPDQRAIDTELERVSVAVGWAVRVADHGTEKERAEASALIDQLMAAEARRDLPTLQTAGRRLASLAWEIGRRARGAAGETEDRAEREAILAVERPPQAAPSCRVCGASQWWSRPGGAAAVCGRCHPPAPGVPARWLSESEARVALEV